MAYVKKITGKEFSLDVVNFMLKKYNITHEDIRNLPNRPDDKDEWRDDVPYQENWFQFYTFDSLEEYNSYMEYFFERYKDYAPKRKWRKYDVVAMFRSFDLMYGLKINYDFEIHCQQKNEDAMYKKVFGKQK
jgi:hypothetical protein